MKKTYILFAIFFFSFLIRIWNVNEMGRTWDEIAYVDPGHKYLQLVKKLEFNDDTWIQYVDALPLPRYLYGMGALLDINTYNVDSVSEYNYDLYYSRLISVFFSSLTVLLVALIAMKYISIRVGVLSGIFLSMLPIFVGLSQLVTIESIQFFFFTFSILTFLWLLEKPTRLKYLLCGMVLGVSLHAKYTNILLIPIFILLYANWYLNQHFKTSLLNLLNIPISKIGLNILRIYKKVSKRKRYSKFNVNLLIMFLAALSVFILFWPMPYFHINEVLESIYKQRFASSIRPPPELFFGKFMEVPVIYYIVYFFITTPLLIILMFLFGLLKIKKEEKMIYFVLIVWFFVPFIQSFYSFRQNGIRYIIEIYAPLSILAALGIDYLAQNISKKTIVYVVISLIATAYLFVTLKDYTPYYLTYFNETVGGVKNVYEKKLFPIGWWGEGMKEVEYYMKKNIPKGSIIGLQLNPMHTLNRVKGYTYYPFTSSRKYDYVIVNYFSEIRQFFDTKELSDSYKKVYNVDVNNVPLVSIYKHK